MNRDRTLQLLGSIHDVIVASVAFYTAFLTYYGTATISSVPGLHDKATLFLVTAAVCFFAFSLNRGSWRYASIPELVAIIKASLVATLLFTAVLFLLSRGDNLPRSVPPLIFVFLVVGLSGPRLMYRLVKEQGYLPILTKGYKKNGQVRDILLFGYNPNAESFIRAVRRADNPSIRIQGIIDDKSPKGLSIQGVSVIGQRKSLPTIIEKFKRRGIEIGELAISDHKLSGAAIGDLISLGNAAGIKITQIPDLADTSNLDARSIEPNPINITNLLGRDEVHVDTKITAALLESKVVLITGAGGSIGSELSRQVASFSPRCLLLVDVSEHQLYLIDSDVREKFPDLEIVAKIADIRDRDRIDRLLNTYKPDVILHAAALKHVPLMETNVFESMKTNVLGAKNMADLAVVHGVRTFVMVSTDKAVNPTNIMGATKRAAEAYCQSLDMTGPITQFKTVRFGNVLGSSGSVVPKFEKQIAKGGPVTVTHPDIVRYFMTIPEAVRLILQASGHNSASNQDRGRILVLEMGNRVRITDLAVKMIELAGFKPHVDIAIEYTDLRPGEKLYEELFDPEEEVELVKKQGYMIAASRPLSKERIDQAILLMEAAFEKADQEMAIEALRNIVPEYSPQYPVVGGNVLSLSREKQKRA